MVLLSPNMCAFCLPAARRMALAVPIPFRLRLVILAFLRSMTFKNDISHLVRGFQKRQVARALHLPGVGMRPYGLPEPEGPFYATEGILAIGDVDRHGKFTEGFYAVERGEKLEVSVGH